MGATKTNQYSTDTIQLAKLANALGHPARITILKTLMENSFFRNSDFKILLELSQSSVHNHLSRLKSANLIEMNYFPHEYHVRLIPEKVEELQHFLNEK